MATTVRNPSAALIEQLHRNPYDFDFFQAVRILEKQAALAAEGADAASGRSVQSVGHDGPPDQESVRFSALQSHAFPASEITSVVQADPEDKSEGAAPPEMTVAFMGLTGPSGVLPDHYTSLIIERMRQQDTALRDFFDTFNHRTISLFYRAWEKYRAAFRYERSARSATGRDNTDDVTQALYSLVGFGTAGIRNRLHTDDEAFVFYGGQLAPRVPSAIGLQQVLGGYLDQAVDVQQFQGQWLYLDVADRSATPEPGQPDGQNMQLGRDAVVGERVWSIESKVRIRIGPVDYASFRSLLPSSPAFIALCQLIRTYLGPEYDFDVQVILDKRQVPQVALTDTSEARLGWNTWVFTADYPHHADQPLFEHDGNPCASTPATNTV